MRNKVPIKQKCTALLLVLLFAGYYAGATMCYHKHHDGDTVLVHSHLFGDRNHHHSINGLEMLAWAHAGLLLLLVAFVFGNRAVAPRKLFFYVFAQAPQSVFVCSGILRGPPYYNLSQI
ncbi:MAG: hypothetical protein WCY79_06895 [Bacteroidales bacterium]|jgi:high-affinity Fe2+/Pb2+ permease